MTSGLAERHVAAPDLLGAQRPRIASVPPYVVSSGPEAIELAARARRPADDWQGYLLTESLGERPDGRWSAPEVCIIVSRQNGKTGVVEVRIAAGLSLFDEELIIYSAHEFKSAMETFRRVLFFIEQMPELARRVSRTVRSTNELGIEFKGGQRVRFVARSGGSGRGFTGDCIILDEAYNLDDRHMDALMPTMLARPNTQLWYLSSAGFLSSVQLGRMRRRGLARDPGVAFFEWSVCAKRLGDPVDDDCLDPANWAKANPALGIRISLESLDRAHRTLGAEGFARECLGVGEYPAEDGEGWAVVSAAAWEACADVNPEPFDPATELLGPVALSLDTTPDHAWTSIGAAGRRLDGFVHLQVVDHRPGTDWAPGRAAELVERYNPCVFVVDKSGPAASLIPALVRAGVAVEEIGAAEVAAGCGHFLDLVGGGRARHLGQQEMSAALKGARRRVIGDEKQWAWARKGIDVVISPIVAVTQAAYGFEVHGESAGQVFGAWR